MWVFLLSLSVGIWGVIGIVYKIVVYYIHILMSCLSHLVAYWEYFLFS